MESSAFYREIECTTVKQFLNLITPWNTDINISDFVFRGHSSDAYKLIPSALRDEAVEEFRSIARMQANKLYKYYTQVKKLGYGNLELHQASMEFIILRRFYRKANAHGLYVPRSKFMSHSLEKDYVPLESLMRLYGYDDWLHRDFLEIAALAQHYGLPTRLIDWTYNPYTAAFFASNSKKKYAENDKITLWLLNYKKLSDIFESKQSVVKFYNPHYQWNDNARSQFGLFTYKQSNLGNDYKKDVLSLYKEIESTGKVPRNKFQNLYTNRESLDKTILDSIKANNEIKEGRHKITGDMLIKITLPAKLAESLNKNLRKINLSEASIFPGYSGVVAELKSGRYI